MSERKKLNRSYIVTNAGSAQIITGIALTAAKIPEVGIPLVLGGWQQK